MLIFKNMVAEKWRNPFLIAFLILVLNERLGNCFLEFSSSSLKSSSKKQPKSRTSPGTSEGQKPVEKYEDIKATMQLFKILEEISDNYEQLFPDARIDPHIVRYPKLHKLILCIQREVLTIKFEYKKHENGVLVDDDYRLEKAGTLTALLIVKFMGYNNAFRLYKALTETKAFESRSDVPDSVKKVGHFLMLFAMGINAEEITELIKKLLEGVDFMKHRVVPVTDRFYGTFALMYAVDAAHKKAVPISASDGTELAVLTDKRQTDELQITFANMLYKYNTVSLAESERVTFLNHKRAAYRAIFGDVKNITMEMERDTDVKTVVKILRKIEIYLAEEFGLYGKLKKEERERINQGSNNSRLVIDLQDNKIILNMKQKNSEDPKEPGTSE